MTSADFAAWLEHQRFTYAEAARRLGCGPNSPRIWATGQKPPLYIALACSAISQGLPPWRKIG